MFWEGGGGAQAGQGAGHGSAEQGTGGDGKSAQGQAQGGRASAANTTTQDRAQGKGKGMGKTRTRAAVPGEGRRDASRAPNRAATERMGRSGVRSANRGTLKDMGKDAGGIRAPAVRARQQVTEDGTRSVGRRAKA